MQLFTLLTLAGLAAASPFASVRTSNTEATSQHETKAPAAETSNPGIDCLYGSGQGCAYMPPAKRGLEYVNDSTTVATTSPQPPFWVPQGWNPPIPLGFAPDPDILPDYDGTLPYFKHTRPEWSQQAMREKPPSSYKRIVTNYNASATYRPVLRVAMHRYNVHECAKKCDRLGDRCHAFGHFKERAPVCSVGVYTKCEELVCQPVEMCELYASALEPGVVSLGEWEWGIEGSKMTRAVRAFNGYNKYWRRPGKKEVDSAVEGREASTTTTAEPGDDEQADKDDSDSDAAVAPRADCDITFQETTTETYRPPPITKTRILQDAPITVTQTEVMHHEPITTTMTVQAAPVTVTSTNNVLFWQTTTPVVTTTQVTTLPTSVSTTTVWATFTDTERSTAMVTDTKTRFRTRTELVTETKTETTTRVKGTTTVTTTTTSVWNAPGGKWV